jgi:hypothetical protein
MKKVINKVFKTYYNIRGARLNYSIFNAEKVQSALFDYLIDCGQSTKFGAEHGFDKIHSYEDFKSRVPISDYTDIFPYIERMMDGERDVLWPGRINWFSKSSGTTNAKSKFIPVSQENLENCHIKGNWNTMTFFYDQREDAKQFECRSIVMGGSLHPYKNNSDTLVGDVSAIMLKNMPNFAWAFMSPGMEVCLMDNFEEKIERMAQITAKQRDIVMIGGVPTWTVVLFKRILEITGASNMLEVWPEFQVYIHGGVSFLPYEAQFKAFFPSKHVDYLEVYNASEGFFAAQNDFSTKDMALFVDSGIFYEFIPKEDFGKSNPRVYKLGEVELDVDYAMIISTNSGLWRYAIGDCVRFTSLHPYKIKITGRTKQYINVFGEELMVENTDRALSEICSEYGISALDYTVGPVFLEGDHKGGHEWLIEFDKEPLDLELFASKLDKRLQELNSDYEAKRFKNMALECLKLKSLPLGTFNNWMRIKGKYGGQNKVPRLSNSREYLESISELLLSQKS